MFYIPGSSAFFAAIFYFIPVLFPFFAPSKWPVADHTKLLREITFLHF